MKRGRPIGSKSFVGVKLSQLCATLNPDCVIPVHKHFFNALSMGNSVEAIELTENQPPAEKDKIEFTVKKFE